MVDAIRRHAQHGARREVVALDMHALRSVGGDLARETDARGGVVAQRFVDDGLEIGQVLDHVVGGHVDVGGDVGVELGLQLGHDAGRADHVEQKRAGRVGGGVGTGDELR